MLKAIIFDVDGVLVDSMRFHADAWTKAFKDVGITIQREDIYELEGSHGRGIVRIIFEREGRTPEPRQLEEIPSKKRSIFEFDKVKPFDGIVDTLQDLKKHFAIALVSGSDRSVVEKIVDRFFPGIFEVTVAGIDVDNGKPAPDPYLKALEFLGYEKKDCLVVENAPLGVQAAKAAGLYCVAVPSTLGPERLQHADIVFEDHKALLKYLRSLIPKDAEEA